MLIAKLSTTARDASKLTFLTPAFYIDNWQRYLFIGILPFWLFVSGSHAGENPQEDCGRG
jgi:hypothetical protein